MENQHPYRHDDSTPAPARPNVLDLEVRRFCTYLALGPIGVFVLCMTWRDDGAGLYVWIAFALIVAGEIHARRLTRQIAQLRAGVE